MKSEVKNTSISLAILPMQILSEDPMVEMFCTGLTMDLITDLSRFRPFQIMPYQEVKKIRDEEQSDGDLSDLDVDYLIKGLVRSYSGDLIFNIQLINATRDRLAWAEKFSGPIENIFHIQEEITKKIVTSLQLYVDYDVLSEIRKKPLTNLNAYECWLKGYQEIKKGTVEADESARAYFRQAIDIDPHFARAFTGMSLSYFNEWSCQLWNRWEISQKGALEWAQQAVEIDETDYVSTTILGRIYLYKGEYEKAEYYLRKSLQLNPNDGENLLQVSTGLIYLGYSDEAYELYQKIIQLFPTENEALFANGTLINIEKGNFKEAISIGEKYPIGKGWVDFPAFMAAAHFHLNNLGKMRWYWEQFKRIFSEKINQGQPADDQTALKWMINVNPYRSKTNLKPFWDYIGDDKIDLNTNPKIDEEPLSNNRFVRKDGLWTICYEGREVRLPDLKGYNDLLKLLSRPYQAIHCSELMGAVTVEKGEVIFDEKAKKAYKDRILEIQQELEEAESLHNEDSMTRLHKEYDELIDHLAKSTGKGGKTRVVNDGVEKARTAVTWRIRNAIKKITDIHPQLGKHFKVSVNTGVFCEYSPEHELIWEVE